MDWSRIWLNLKIINKNYWNLDWKYKLFLKKNSNVKFESIKNVKDRVENKIIIKPKDTTKEEDKKNFFGLLKIIRDMDLL